MLCVHRARRDRHLPRRGLRRGCARARAQTCHLDRHDARLAERLARSRFPDGSVVLHVWRDRGCRERMGGRYRTRSVPKTVHLASKRSVSPHTSILRTRNRDSHTPSTPIQQRTMLPSRSNKFSIFVKTADFMHTHGKHAQLHARRVPGQRRNVRDAAYRLRRRRRLRSERYGVHLRLCTLRGGSRDVRNLKSRITSERM